MLYDLSLHMGYTYDTPAHGARHIIRVLPLSIPGRQRLVAGSIDVSPTPEERVAFDDFFHQSATSVHLRAPHEKLDIRMQARVMVEAPALTADFSPELYRLPQEACRCLVARFPVAAPFHWRKPEDWNGRGDIRLCPGVAETRNDHSRNRALSVQTHPQGFHL